MSRAKGERELTQFSHWIRSDLARELKAKAKRQNRRQKALIEEALVDLLKKPDAPPG